MAQNLTGTFVATGQSVAFRPDGIDDRVGAAFNISLWGTFVATVTVERSFDKGTTWLPLTVGGSSSLYTYTAPVSETLEEIEADVVYRLNCTAFTSGTVNYRISS